MRVGKGLQHPPSEREPAIQGDFFAPTAAARRARRSESPVSAASLWEAGGCGGVAAAALSKKGLKTTFFFLPRRGSLDAIRSWVLGSALSSRPPAAPKSCGHAARHAPPRPPPPLRSAHGGGPAFPVHMNFFDVFHRSEAFRVGKLPPPAKRQARSSSLRCAAVPIFWRHVARHAPRLLIAPREFRRCASRAILSRVPIWADFWADRAFLCGKSRPPPLPGSGAHTSRPYKNKRAG